MDQPIIEEQPREGMQPERGEEVKLEEVAKVEEPEAMEDEGKAEETARANLEEILNQPEMQQEEEKLAYRERKTRWGERRIKRSKIQEDAVFNPLEAMYHGQTLLPITQYGQAELEIKKALYSEGKLRKSKWHHEIEKTFTPPMLNYISPSMGVDEVEYLLRLYRLDELNSQMNHFVMDDPDLRSPSPDPIYDNTGKRINTREVRKRDAFLRERISLIEDCMKMRKSFVPPDDYKPLKKFKKIYLTDNAVNDTKANYIGKIIGPQGKTQKLIEQRSGCKISVRGRGANRKEKDIFENNEPMHIIIVADKDEELERGVEEVSKILNGEEDQEMKDLLESYNMQVQGIYENYCENCQQEGHRTWACPFQAKSHMTVKCTICGETSHPTSDCPQKQAFIKQQEADKINMLLQSQYSQFKEDLDKPKGGAAFITDFEHKKQLLAIGQGPAAPEGKTQQKPAPKAQNKPIALAAPAPAAQDLPKFQDE